MAGYLHTTLETISRNEAQIKLSAKVNNQHRHTSFSVRLGESRPISMPDELFEEADRPTVHGGYEVGSNFDQGESNESDSDKPVSSDEECNDKPLATATGTVLESHLETVLHLALHGTAAYTIKEMYDEVIQGGAENKNRRVEELVDHIKGLEDEERATFLEDKVF